MDSDEDSVDYDHLTPEQEEAFDLLYPVQDDDPPEDNRKTSTRMISADRVPTNPNIYVTAAEAERRYGIPAPRIHRWKARGMVLVRGYRSVAPLFLPSELRALNRRAEEDDRSGKRDVAA